MFELISYTDEAGHAPFAKWLAGVDRTAAQRVTIALGRLEDGNTSQLKSVGEGLHELRIAFGPGYRIYLGRDGGRLVVLLWGGTKHRQPADIVRAKRFWAAYKTEQT